MTCGEGHNHIAKALKTEFDERGIENKIIQLFGFSEKEVEKQNKLFLNACKYIPHLYNFIWETQRKRNPHKKEKGYMSTVIRACKSHIKQQIEQYKPDVIICTHNNSGAVVGALKKEGFLDDVTTYSIVTDYCLCPYWETNTDLDYVELPFEDLIKNMEEKLFTKQQLLPFGLVIDKKYTKNILKKDARQTLGIGENEFVISLYSGGNCASPNFPVVKKLVKSNLDIKIISVCGRNQKQKNKIDKFIEKHNVKNVINMGFCTNLDMVFSASDIVLSRGGGQGLTEQINSGVPFVFREKLIINERINRDIFCALGMAKSMKKVADAPKIVEQLKNNPNELAFMRENIKKFCKPNSTQKFVDFIVKEREQK